MKLVLLFVQGFKFRIKLTAFIFLSVISLEGLSQESYQLGHGNLVVSPRKKEPLKFTMHSNASLASFGFVGKVGGVAFSAIALPDEELKVKTFTITYRSENSDGHRLLIVLNSDTFYPNIYDWQLIPIARYADSDYNACVSLFGPETNDYQYDIRYHECLQNTLLGVRILQSDMLLMNLAEFWQLPKENGTKTVLGKGEFVIDNSTWWSAAMKIDSVIEGENYRSWVLTDDNINVRFKIKEKKFILTGNPYYYFWSLDEREYLEKVAILERIAKEADSNGDINAYNNAINKMNSLEPKVVPQGRLTQKMKKLNKELEIFNPIVYKAVANTMRYAAFFRYAKQKSKFSWDQFISSIKYVSIQPDVKTPDSWAK